MTDQDTPVRESVRFIGDVGLLFEALAKAQGEFIPLAKDAEVEVKKEGRLLYTFKYCPLDVVIAATQPALVKHGLAFMQFPDGDELLSVLGHKDGRIESRCRLTDWKSVQDFGGAITYVKRYAMVSMLCVFPAGEDDDGNQASGNQAAVTQRPRAVPPVAKPSEPAKPGDLTPATKARIKELSAANGFQNAELEAFSVKHGCGTLPTLNEAKGAALVKLLEAQQVQP